jgi:hypothetical protein
MIHTKSTSFDRSTYLPRAYHFLFSTCGIVCKSKKKIFNDNKSTKKVPKKYFISTERDSFLLSLA